MDTKTSKARPLQSTFRLQDPLETFGKTAPQVAEIEASVLGALLLERNAISDVIEILRPDVFYTPAHQKIYQTILKLFNQNIYFSIWGDLGFFLHRYSLLFRKKMYRMGQI